MQTAELARLCDPACVDPHVCGEAQNPRRRDSDAGHPLLWRPHHLLSPQCGLPGRRPGPKGRGALGSHTDSPASCLLWLLP